MTPEYKNISPASERYTNTPSAVATRTFFYPLCLGHYFYEKGYQLQRDSFDSFCLMYLYSGQMTVTQDGKVETARAHQYILLDCYRPYGYRTDTGCECLWFHFDGPMARNYYELIQNRLNTVFSLQNTNRVIQKMKHIYDAFEAGAAIQEALLSKQLSDILTYLLLDFSLDKPNNHIHYLNQIVTMDEVRFYINTHYQEALTLEGLAQQAAMSPTNFIRSFHRETGCTPHEYLIHTRINAAKYLLKNSDRTVRQICFETGFSCESVFCSAFKRYVSMTPSAYRNGGSM